jgi:hypothetical protein
VDVREPIEAAAADAADPGPGLLAIEVHQFRVLVAEPKRHDIPLLGEIPVADVALDQEEVHDPVLWRA